MDYAALKVLIKDAGAAPRALALSWGDNPVSSCRPFTRATGPGTSAGAFPMALSLSGEDPRGPRLGAKGSSGTPGAPAEFVALSLSPRGRGSCRSQLSGPGGGRAAVSEDDFQRAYERELSKFLQSAPRRSPLVPPYRRHIQPAKDTCSVLYCCHASG